MRASMLLLEETRRHSIEMWMGRRPLPKETKASRTVHQLGKEGTLVCGTRYKPWTCGILTPCWVLRTLNTEMRRHCLVLQHTS